MTGRAYLVGSGPGGLGLMTIRAREVIDSADVVLYDQLPGEEILATLPKNAERIDCGKYGGSHTLEQDAIEELMVRKVKEGKTVVRLKGGDPFLFGRGGEEIETLREHGIAVEVVPGVTSAIAVPEMVGIPVTHRRYASQVTFITGHEDPTKPESALDWEVLARLKGTLVILMGVKNLPAITAALVEHGKDPATPVAIIERGLRPDQRVTVGTVADIPEKARAAGVRPPAVIVIGGVVELYEEDGLSE
ncbi:uroporphyrinogen-III C-methyltransferase [Methanoculleus sp. Wushi-C6]|uniref:uroporphyrinogen-III C-methyltransferase n=1 Tax=Methanoculleus caldifontis TaxID=2651577 RepID=A0ABU3X2J8_9EURY|nr:uroporphyrinogen-III C-methyltransferase [Methanoculleus sp. Wushi-C6]MDV2482298.1 uroporphyrinogen-III C-methyltransferase [Methanoculleus sp. Wushi-C6]